jgi:hypothetical protein
MGPTASNFHSANCPLSFRNLRMRLTLLLNFGFSNSHWLEQKRDLARPSRYQ